MSCVSYSDLRQNLAHYLDEAVSTRAPIIITRKAGKGSVVLMSEEEFSGWQETVHLLSSPRNAERLLRSIHDAENDAATERELLEPTGANRA